MKFLKELDSINDLLISDFEYLVKGLLGDELLSPVYAHQVQYAYKTGTRGTQGDVRCNILGMEGIALLLPEMLIGYDR